MGNTASLRRRAEVCLRLSQFSSDAPVAAHLQFLAARYHEEALRVEFAAPANETQHGVFGASESAQRI